MCIYQSPTWSVFQVSNFVFPYMLFTPQLKDKIHFSDVPIVSARRMQFIEPESHKLLKNLPLFICVKCMVNAM